MVTEQFFEDYEIGFTRRSFGRTITEADIVAHAGQTGDFFPHHMDAEWCATQEFKRRIAHGTLILSAGIGMTATTMRTAVRTTPPKVTRVSKVLRRILGLLSDRPFLDRPLLVTAST